MLIVHLQADEQVEIGCSHAVSGRRTQDLLQLLERIEAEGLHAMAEIGFGDCLFGLNRMHEAEHRIREGVMDETDFGDRSHIIIRHPRVPENLQQIGRGIRFHRIKGSARELLHEKAGRAPSGVRTKQRNRLNRSAIGDVGNRTADRGGR